MAGLPINDLVSLLGKIIYVELTSEAKDLFLYLKVTSISKNDKEIIISGIDDEGFNRGFPIKWVKEYRVL